MICITQVLLFGLVGVQSVYTSNRTVYCNLDNAPRLFEKFVKDFNKVYKNKEDKKTHFEQFKKNLEKMNNSLNGKNLTSIEGINQFADMNEVEKRMYYVVVPRLRSRESEYNFQSYNLFRASFHGIASRMQYSRACCCLGV